jgi:hypothetical protein
LKIAFWSISNEKCNVSANLAAISVASVIRYPYSVVMVENRITNNNMGKAFLENNCINFVNEAGTNYYDGGGIEGLLRKIDRGNYSSDMVKIYLRKIINQHLYYIPQSRIIHNEIFDYEFEHCFQPLFQMLEDYADICMINADNRNILSTKTILEEADLIVVNLCQRQCILEDFFNNYSSLIQKAIFIISDYDCRVFLNSKRICSQYQIPYEDLILLPSNVSYQNAYISGSVVEFIYRNYSCPKTNPNFIFIHSIKKAAFMIIKKAEAAVKEKELAIY